MATQNAADTQNPVQVAKGGTGVASTTAYAVLCGGTTSTAAIQSIASVGTTGQVLLSNGASALPTFQSIIGGTPTIGDTPIYNTAGSLVTQDLSKFSLMFDDMQYYAPLGWSTQLWPWNATVSGASAVVVGLNNESGHLGIVRGSTGTTTTGSAYFNRGYSIDLGDDIIRFESLIRFPDLSTAGEEYNCNIGIHNARSAGVPASTGVYFEYNRSNSTNWRGVCATGGSLSRSTGTNVAVTAGSWHHLVFTINQGATSVDFSVDGTDIGAVTGNIPTAMDTICVYIIKSAGSTARSVDCDFVKVFFQFGTDRY